MSTISKPLRKSTPASWIGLLIVLTGVASFFVVNRWLVPQLEWTPFAEQAINDIARYQVTMLGITFIILGLLYVLFRDNFRRFAHIGDFQTQTQPVKWLNITANDRWLSVGINFTVIVTLATTTFLFFSSLQGDLSHLRLNYFGVAIILASSNSFIEEVITRFGVVVSLHGVYSNGSIALLSALLFGIPHYFGTPGGPIGALMAGFLGWLLAKSMLETKGIFWAWFIHFVQDVVIYTVVISLAVSL